MPVSELESLDLTIPRSVLKSEPRRAPFDGRPIKKTIYTLNVGDYEPRITELTYPFLKHYAKKIGADFHVIKERKFPEWPIVYEKLQIHELAKQNQSDWNIYIDSDALVSPEFFDITEHLTKGTIAHNGKDMATVRWKYDQYFRRDGRHWGSCNWFTVASDWCLDVWRPLDDLTPEEAFSRISTTIGEHNSGQCKTEHLIDDFTLSRNIARFGLKATTVTDICGNLGWKMPDGRSFSPHLFHLYTLTVEQKLERLLLVLSSPMGTLIANRENPNAPPWGVGWGLMNPESADELRKRWGLKR